MKSTKGNYFMLETKFKEILYEIENFGKRLKMLIFREAFWKRPFISLFAMANSWVTKITTRSIYEDYEISLPHTKGSFGAIMKAKQRSTNTVFIVKKIAKTRVSDLVDGIPKEIIMLKLCTHPYIVKYFDMYIDTDNYYIVMEHVKRGELFDLIIKKGKLTELQAKKSQPSCYQHSNIAIANLLLIEI